MTQEASQRQLYICRACGLIYDEDKGDPDSGIAPGTRFEDIPMTGNAHYAELPKPISSHLSRS